jgi:hypothetical protein
VKIRSYIIEEDIDDIFMVEKLNENNALDDTGTLENM